MGLEHNEALVVIILIFINFPEKFPQSKKGVVTLSFPELKKLNKFFGDSWYLLESIKTLKPW